MKRLAKIGIACMGLACSMALGAASLLKPGNPRPLSLRWNQSTPFPEPTAGYAAGVVRDKLVIAGGTFWLGTKHNWIKKIFSATTYCFDPLTHQWQKLPDAPIPLGYAASTVVGSKLFVIGGYTGLKVNREVFTLQRKGDHYVWEKFGEIPADRVFAAAVSIAKDIYLVGGSTQFEPLDAIGTCCTTKTATNTLMVLDTTHPEKGWRELAPFPGAPRLFSTAETDGKSIWMFGGQFRANAGDPVKNFDEVLRYDPSGRKWKRVATLPEALKTSSYVSPLFAKERMILISSIKKVWQLDLQALKFTELTPLPEEATVDKFVWLGGHLVGSGGENNQEGPRRRSDWTFIGSAP